MLNVNVMHFIIYELWLLTHYYSFGSLFDFLTRNVLSHSDMMLICLSIANGLVHLHTEIFGTEVTLGNIKNLIIFFNLSIFRESLQRFKIKKYIS